jgi:hypothetical protein
VRRRRRRGRRGGCHRRRRGRVVLRRVRRPPGGPARAGGFDPGDPAALEAAVAETAGTVDALRDSAPPEIEGAAADLAGTYDAAFAIFERYGYDLARVETEATPDEQATLDAFGREGAADEIDDFIAARCAPGITIP